MKRVRTVILWFLSVAIAGIMILQGADKFSADGRWASSFAEWGYPTWFRVVVGVLEAGGGIALVIPPAAVYGAVAIAAVMVGAVGTLLLNGRAVDAVTPALYALILVWIAWERRQLQVGARAGRRSAGDPGQAGSDGLH